MLPEGFSSSNCEVKTAKLPAIEKVTCGQSSASGGPSEAAFGLYGSVDDMQTGFKQLGGDQINIAPSCPGDQVFAGSLDIRQQRQDRGPGGMRHHPDEFGQPPDRRV